MGGVHRLAAAAEAEMAADPVGDGPGLGAGQGLAADLGNRGERRGGVAQRPVPVGGRDVPGSKCGREHGPDERPPAAQRRSTGDLTSQGVPDDHAGPVPGESLPAGEAGVGERPARGFQGQPVGRVGGQESPLVDAESGPVEPPSLEERGAGDGSAGWAWRDGLAASVRESTQPPGRQPPERAPPSQGALEQGQRIVSVREPAG